MNAIIKKKKRNTPTSTSSKTPQKRRAWGKDCRDFEDSQWYTINHCKLRTSQRRVGSVINQLHICEA